ncbi:MerR family transcriptional regulator [Niallia sp. Man26]|uniref:MerR family transcriptional regulator n=1 Tax=Niallia sp. Man26 TaxID=2912824 RepID=UPI001EDB7291|nr:MerR family transcriptional regulator [Niallia sp. Man26]UPO90140.1 MerR family transcriptional regulator [Niallia sp. Man26]
MYTVKEVAKMLDITEHTVRFYTDKGLVPSLKRDKNNNRLFDQDSVNWLKGAKALKKAGMSVEAIKNYVDLCLKGDETVIKRYEIILEQKDVALKKLEEAKEIAALLEKKAARYLDIINQEMPDHMNPAKWGDNNNKNEKEIEVIPK